MSLTYAGYGILVTIDPKHDLPSYYYMLPSLGISLGGQFFVFFQMFFAYTSDYSDSQQEGNRKFTRFIMAEGAVYFGAVAGSYASGLCYAKFGYQTVFFASCGLNTLGLIYSLFYMSNIKQEKATSSGSALEKPAPSLMTQLRTAWDNRGQGRLLLVCVLIICFTLFEVPFPLDDNFLFLYFKHTQQWDEEEFTNFQALLWLSMVIGQFALTPLLTKVVKLSTPLIGFLSAASKVSYYLIIANAKSRTMIYLACLACLEGGVGNIVSRSMLAQLVPQRELGKVYGLLAILDAALPFLALPLANPLWDATIDTMPGAFCLVNAGVMGVLGVLYLIVWALQRQYNLQPASAS